MRNQTTTSRLDGAALEDLVWHLIELGGKSRTRFVFQAARLIPDNET